MTDLAHVTSIDVCVDCYFAHHCGYTRYIGESVNGWLVGPDFDAPKDLTHCEPLSLVPEGWDVTDWTYDDSDPENEDQIERYGSGHTTFSWTYCQGCGSTLGGGRERLALWPPNS